MGFIFSTPACFVLCWHNVYLVIFVQKTVFRSDEPMFRYVKKFRDAVFIAVFLIILLYFQARNYLHWWNAGVLAGAFLFYVIFTWSNNKTNKQDI